MYFLFHEFSGSCTLNANVREGKYIFHIWKRHRPSLLRSGKPDQTALRRGGGGVFSFSPFRRTLARSLVGFTFHRKGNFRWEEIKRNAGFHLTIKIARRRRSALPLHQITAGMGGRNRTFNFLFRPKIVSGEWKRKKENLEELRLPCLESEENRRLWNSVLLTEASEKKSALLFVNQTSALAGRGILSTKPLKCYKSC